MGQHMQSMQWLWQHLKGYYGKVIAFLIQTDFFSWIYGWPEEWKLYTFGKLWAISPFILPHTRGVTIHLAHEMRQNTDTWFTRKRQYFNNIFRNFQWQNICFLITKSKTMQLYSGDNNYLIPCWFCKFARLKKIEGFIIFMVGLF